MYSCSQLRELWFVGFIMCIFISGAGTLCSFGVFLHHNESHFAQAASHVIGTAIRGREISLVWAFPFPGTEAKISPCQQSTSVLYSVCRNLCRKEATEGVLILFQCGCLLEKHLHICSTFLCLSVNPTAHKREKAKNNCCTADNLSPQNIYSTVLVHVYTCTCILKVHVEGKKRRSKARPIMLDTGCMELTCQCYRWKHNTCIYIYFLCVL